MVCGKIMVLFEQDSQYSASSLSLSLPHLHICNKGYIFDKVKKRENLEGGMDKREKMSRESKNVEKKWNRSKK